MKMKLKTGTDLSRLRNIYYRRTIYIRHYDSGYKGFSYSDFTYNINKCNITYISLIIVICKVIY
jgi:hypothetical protein